MPARSRADRRGRRRASRTAQPRLAARGLRLRHQAPRRVVRALPGEVLGVVALEGQGQDELFDILAGAMRPSRRRAPRRRCARVLRPPGGRDPGGSRLRRGRSGRGPADAALRPREHRAAIVAGIRRWGLINTGRERGPWSAAIATLQIDTRAQGRGPAAVGWQPAEGDDRPLGRRRRPHDALLRSDPRHRHPDEAADLRAAARPGRGRRRGAVLHVRAQGDPARLRPGDRHLRRPRRGRDRARPTRTSRPCCAPHTTCAAEQSLPEEVGRRRGSRCGGRQQSAKATSDRRPAEVGGG